MLQQLKTFDFCHFFNFVPDFCKPQLKLPNLLRSRFLGGALRDIPKNGCEGD